MTDDGPEDRLNEWKELYDTNDGGVSDIDPRYLDPADAMADLAEIGAFGISLAEDADREELEEFTEQVEAGEVEPDPGLEGTVRIVRMLLDDTEED